MNKSQFSWFASRVKKGKEGGRGKGDSARQVGRLGRQVEQEGRGGRTKAFQSRFLLLTYAGAALLATWGLGPAAGQRVSWISSIGGSGQQSTVTTARYWSTAHTSYSSAHNFLPLFASREYKQTIFPTNQYMSVKVPYLTKF